MSGEIEKNISGWTVDTLKEYLESRIDANDTRYDQRFQAQEAAGLYQREITNEFRGQLGDQAEKFITRAEALARAQANADKIDALQARIDRNEGRSGGLNQGWGYLVGAIGLAATVIMIVIALNR
jgi:hypothetical protein